MSTDDECIMAMLRIPPNYNAEPPAISMAHALYLARLHIAGIETEAQPLAEWEIELADSLLVDVDLNADVPCSVGECTTQAAWMLILDCGHHCLCCPEHRGTTEEFVSDKTHAWCTECEQDTSLPLTWRPL